MTASQFTPEEQAQIDRAMAALDTLAAVWAAKANIRIAVRAMMVAPDAENRLVEFVKQAYAEGAYDGRTSK